MALGTYGSPSALGRFRQIVFADSALQQELRRAPDRATFVDLVVARARERGFALDRAAINANLDAAKRDWLLQWMAR